MFSVLEIGVGVGRLSVETADQVWQLSSWSSSISDLYQNNTLQGKLVNACLVLEDSYRKGALHAWASSVPDFSRLVLLATYHVSLRAVYVMDSNWGELLCLVICLILTEMSLDVEIMTFKVLALNPSPSCYINISCALTWFLYCHQQILWQFCTL